MAADDFCYLTTTGRRTGRPHRIEIWYAAPAGSETLYLLSGGGRSSDWVQNLVTDPAVVLELDGVVGPARARIVEDPVESAQARSLVFAKYAPRYDGDLTGWRERSLAVAVEPERGSREPSSSARLPK